MNITKEILDWPCKKCGVLNRYHEMFMHHPTWFERQPQLYDTPKLVPSSDHYADPPLNNLEYLEYMYERKSNNL
jgi:hypothetical protein